LIGLRGSSKLRGNGRLGTRWSLPEATRLALTVDAWWREILGFLETRITNERASHCTFNRGCGAGRWSGWHSRDGAGLMVAVASDIFVRRRRRRAAARRGSSVGQACPRVVEVLAAAVDATTGDEPAALPFLDGVGGDAEVACDLVEISVSLLQH
jgi:hypothetical protein